MFIKFGWQYNNTYFSEMNMIEKEMEEHKIRKEERCYSWEYSEATKV